MTEQRVCPSCRGRNTYLDCVPGRRQMAMYCTNCGWTDDPSVQEMRIAMGQDPLTGKTRDYR